MEQILAPGTLLHERYKITQVLSQDSIGAIYRVIDVKITENAYAVREFFSPPVPPQERSLLEKKFLEITRFLATLHHPNLVRVLDAFVEGNRFYAVTEFAEGLHFLSLAELSGNPISEQQILDWLIQACGALAYLHHRAPPVYQKLLSPTTLIVDRDGRLRIEGFGLPLLFAPSKEGLSPYLAPEITSWESGSAAGDLYGLSAGFYYLLSRRVPNPKEASPQNLISTVSPRTSQLLMSCLRLEPELRPGDAKVLGKAFDEILHPPQTAPAFSRKTRFELLLENAKSFLKKTVRVGTAVAQRPYLIGLTALLIWAAYASFRSEVFKTFHKTGPLLYVTSRYQVDLVDPATLRIVDRIDKIEHASTIIAPPDYSEVWFTTPNGQIYKIDPEKSSVAGKFNAGQPLGGIARASKDLLYATLDRDNTLGIFALATGKAILFRPVARLPKDIVYNRRQREIYVTASTSQSLSVFDTDKYLVKQRIVLDFAPRQMIESPDENYIYIVYDNASRVDVFDANSKTRQAIIPLPDPGPYAISAYAQGIVVTLLQKNKILMYRYPGGTQKAEINLDKPTAAIYVDSANKIFALTRAGYLYAIDPSTGKITKHASIGGLPKSLLFVP